MRMVETQIIARGVVDDAVVRAMRSVPRHRFVPDALRDQAYADRPLPIGEGQTISQPYIVAFMTAGLELKPGEKILEIGTGSGYQAAILQEMGLKVYSIEINRKLADQAKCALVATGYGDVQLRVGDGYKGWGEHGPFDAIIVTCAPSQVPQPLIDQLSERGRMIIPVDVQFGQELVVLRKKDGKLIREDVLAVRFVPMINEQGKKY